MLKKKAQMSFFSAKAVIVVVFLAVIFIFIWPTLGTAKDTFFDLLGIGEEKCEDTWKTFREYESELTNFFKNPNRFKTDITKNDDVTQTCNELKSCFPKEYESFENECASLKSYKCQIDALCKITSDTPCYCYTSGAYAVGKPPEICTEGKYCYPDGYGCYNTLNVDACKEKNPNFQLPSACEVDNACQVQAVPCFCNTAGSKMDPSTLPEVCTSGQFCYEGGIGCDDRARTLECEKTKPKQPSLCEIDSLCKITSTTLCSCYTSGAQATGAPPERCTLGQYCYPNGYGCDDGLLVGQCKEKNPNFQLPSACEVDNVCQVNEVPCSCNTAGGELPEICTSGQFCYEKSIGCDDRADEEKCKETNPQFKQPPLCEIDSLCKITSNLPCTCPRGSSPEICTKEKPYCYPEGYACHDKLKVELCKEKNPNFKLPSACQVENTCQAKDVPCSCNTAGGELPEVCTSGQFCYEGSIGCDNRADETKVGQCSS